MADVSLNDMKTVAARLRAEAEAKQQIQEARLNPRDTDMTIEEILAEIATTMQVDSFFRDLAAPLDAARDTLKAGTQASRQQAIVFLQDVVKNVDKAKLFFDLEKGILKKVITRLEDEGTPASLQTLLEGVRTTRSPETLEALAKCQEEWGRKEQKMRESIKEGPWEFKEHKDQQEITVTIPVPAETKASDIKITSSAAALRVMIKDDVVLDGELTNKIDTESFGWVVEGSGTGRKLVIDMDKTMGGFMWDRLLK